MAVNVIRHYRLKAIGWLVLALILMALGTCLWVFGLTSQGWGMLIFMLGVVCVLRAFWFATARRFGRI